MAFVKSKKDRQALKKFFQSRPWNMACMNKSIQCGFSLFELLIVITLVTTLSLMVGTTYTWLNQLMVHAEVDNLYSTCRYLQQCALITGKQQELIFDPSHAAFSYH